MKKIMEPEISNYIDCFNENILQLNSNKTEFFAFKCGNGKRSQVDLKVNNRSFSDNQHVNYLAVTKDIDK